MENSTRDKYREELLPSRRLLKDEMQRAIKAIKPREKIALVAFWKETYKPEVVDELLRVARDREAKVRIANWNLEQFDSERIKK